MWLLLGFVAAGLLTFEVLKKKAALVTPNATQVLVPGNSYLLNVFLDPSLGSDPPGVATLLLGSADLAEVFESLGSLPTLVATGVPLPGSTGSTTLVSQWHMPVRYAPKVTSFPAPTTTGQMVEHMLPNLNLLLPMNGSTGTIEDATLLAVSQ